MREFKYVFGEQVPRALNDIIEPIKYQSDASQETIQAMKERVFIYAPNIIYYKEIQVQTPFSVTLMLGRALELSQQPDSRGIIIDVRSASRPDAPTRRVLAKIFKEISKQLTHVCFLTDNLMIDASIRFVMYGLNLKSYSVSRNFEDIILEVNEKVYGK